MVKIAALPRFITKTASRVKAAKKNVLLNVRMMKFSMVGETFSLEGNQSTCKAPTLNSHFSGVFAEMSAKI